MYTSHSIASILSFEIEEIEVRKPSTTDTAPITETTPSDLSDPLGQVPATNEVSRLKEEVKKYQQELEKCTIQMEKFQAMLETVMTKIEKMSTPVEESTNRRLD